MFDPISATVSVLALAVSSVTAWLTLFRRGPIRMPQPITSHRTKNRRKPLRSGVLVCVPGFSVTFQNTRLGSVPLMPDLIREQEGLRSAQATRAKAFWSG
jgi:hypothetical protein